jgi:hypothetical protein
MAKKKAKKKKTAKKKQITLNVKGISFNDAVALTFKKKI